MESSSPLSVLTQDENVRSLYESIDAWSTVSSTDIINWLTNFRKSVSFAWLRNLSREDRRESIILVFRTLLSYTDHPEATVRVNTYNSIGGFVLFVTPFSPTLVMECFGVVVSTTPVSPRPSIAIINTFVYLTRFVSPHKIATYSEEVPILPHFGVDISDFIDFLHPMISKMNRLPLAFHRNLLRSVVFSQGRAPSLSFSKVVIELISLDPASLIPDLMSHIIHNSLTSSMLHLSHPLTASDQFFSYLTESDLEYIEDCCVKELSKRSPHVSLFDYSAKTLYSLLIRKVVTPDFVKQTIRSDYPKHLYPRLLPLSHIFTESPSPSFSLSLEYDPNSYDYENSIRVHTICQRFVDYLSSAAETCSLLKQYAQTSGDLYIKFLESITLCFPRILMEYEGNEIIEIIEESIKREATWIQDRTLARLINTIPYDVLFQKKPSIEALLIDKLLRMARSPHILLRKSALESLRTLNPNPRVADKYAGDLFDEDLCAHRVELLTVLKSGGRELIEAARLHKSDVIWASVFNLALHVPGNWEVMIPKALDVLSRGYSAFSKVPMFDGTEIRDLGGIDTDIVANAELDHKTVLDSAAKAFNYLTFYRKKLGKYTNEFRRACFCMIPLFDGIAINSARLVGGGQELERYAMTIIESSASEKVVERCLEVFVESPHKAPAAAQKILEIDSAPEPSLAFLCIVMVDRESRDKAVETAIRVLKKMNERDAITLGFKLSTIMRKELEAECSWLPGIVYVRDNDERCMEYTKNHRFHEWPIEDPEIFEAMGSFVRRTKNIQISNPEALDTVHWRFLLINHEGFDGWEVVKEYSTKYPREFIFKSGIGVTYDSWKRTIDQSVLDRLDILNLFQSLAEGTPRSFKYEKVVAGKFPSISLLQSIGIVPDKEAPVLTLADEEIKDIISLEFKGKHYLRLASIILEKPVSPTVLTELISFSIVKLVEHKTIKKQASVLRVVSASLFKLISNRHLAAVRTSAPAVIEQMSDLIYELPAALQREAAILFSLLSPWSPETALQALPTDPVYRLIYLSAVAGVAKRYPVEGFPDFILPLFTKPCPPSVLASAIQSLNSANKSLELFIPFMIDYMPLLASQQKTGLPTIIFVKKLITAGNYTEKLIDAFSKSFLSDPSSGMFDASLTVVPLLAAGGSKMWPIVFQGNEENIRELYWQMVSELRGKPEMFDFLEDAFEQCHQYYLKKQTTQSAEILANVISDFFPTVDPASYLFGKLPIQTDRFLSLFVCLARFIRDSKYHIREQCFAMIEATHDSLKPLSRGQALMELKIGYQGDLRKALTIAASECDDYMNEVAWVDPPLTFGDVLAKIEEPKE